MTKPLTAKEKKWIEDMNLLLSKCPKRFGFYTIGDRNLSIYDLGKDMAIHKKMDVPSGGMDFGCAVAECNAALSDLRFPVNVHSTAG